jgi:predicted transcriptional regulator
MVQRRSRGVLETAVLRILWHSRRPLTAREIQACFDQDARVPALTTVLTVLDRLRVKQLVDKASSEGGFVFSAARSQSGYVADAMMAALATAEDRSPALLQFAATLDPGDLATLRRALSAGDVPGEPE